MPELGTKHECASCGGKFYDFGKADPVCPKCETPLGEGDEAGAKKGTKKGAKKGAKKKASAKSSKTKKKAAKKATKPKK